MICKSLRIMLAAVLTASLVSACNVGSNKNPGSTSSSSTTPNEQSEKKEPVDLVFYFAGTKMSEEDFMKAYGNDIKKNSHTLRLKSTALGNAVKAFSDVALNTKDLNSTLSAWWRIRTKRSTTRRKNRFTAIIKSPAACKKATAGLTLFIGLWRLMLNAA